MRYVLEGTWSGYTFSQRRVVHREVISAKRAERLKILRGITYTDGTSLWIKIREATHREKITPKDSYGKLIREAEATGKSWVNVADLQKEVAI